MFYDVDIEASACILSSHYAMTVHSVDRRSVLSLSYSYLMVKINHKPSSELLYLVWLWLGTEPLPVPAPIDLAPVCAMCASMYHTIHKLTQTPMGVV